MQDREKTTMIVDMEKSILKYIIEDEDFGDAVCLEKLKEMTFYPVLHLGY